MLNPCHNCPDRCASPNCHITCKKYAEIVARSKERAEMKEKERASIYPPKEYFIRLSHK